MKLRTVAAAAVPVLAVTLVGLGGVSLAQDEPAPGEEGGGAPSAEQTDVLEQAWDTLEQCLDDAVDWAAEPPGDATEGDWEAFEAQIDAAEEDCIAALTPDQQAALEAEEQLWQAFDECVDGQVDRDAEPGDDASESTWRAFEQQMLAAEQACADQLPEPERTELAEEVAEIEAWMAYDRCLADQGVLDLIEPSLEEPRSAWDAFDERWEAAEEACGHLEVDDEWCDDDHGHGSEDGDDDEIDESGD